MPQYSWKKAKDHLTTVEMERLACCMLLQAEQKVSWTEAAEEFGTTPAGFRVSMFKLLKKLRERGCIRGGEGGDEGGDDDGDDQQTTPKKRNGPADGDADEAGTPSKKPRTPRKKAVEQSVKNAVSADVVFVETERLMKDEEE